MRGITGCKKWLWLVTLSLLFFLLITAGTGGLQWTRRIPRDDVDRFVLHLEERLLFLMEKHQIPGVSLALVQDGQIVWADAFGYADLESGSADCGHAHAGAVDF